MPPYLTQSRLRITASIDGTPVGAFSSFSGGEVTWEEVRFRPAAGESEVVLAGPRAVGNVTLGRKFDGFADSAILARYANRPGVRVVITQQALDANNAPFAAPLPPLAGVLVRMSRPEADADGTDAAMLELEVAIGAEG